MSSSGSSRSQVRSPCSFSASQLTRISLDRIVAVSMAVEDPAGDAVMLSFYNAAVGNHYTGPELDLLFPLGAILAIREPNFKSPSMGGSGIIRVDSPTDIIFLSETDALLDEIKWEVKKPISPFSRNCDYKVEGNRYFAKRDYILAESIYSRGLRENPSTEQRLLLHLNRAAAHLQLSNFASAGRDATAVLEAIEEMDDPDSQENMKLKEKALFRLANSQYGQRKFPLAKSTFTTLLQQVTTSQQAADGIAKCEAREKESATGEYDLLGMYRAGKKGGAVRLDVADYQGPIKVEQVAGRGGGRGVVAARNIRAGELLVLEKAFAVTFIEDLDPRFPILSIDMIRSAVSFSPAVAQVIKIANKLSDDPSLLSVVNSLYAGPKSTQPIATSVENFVASNSAEDTAVEGFGVDVTRIEEIGTFNAYAAPRPPVRPLIPVSRRFTATSHLTESPKAEEVKTGLRNVGTRNSPSALFPLASMFNHQCSPSASWRIYGDVIVVRAVRDIEMGREILIEYVGGDYEDRTAGLVTHFGEKRCGCAMCNADREDGKARREKRTRIMDVDRRVLESLLLESHSKEKLALMKKAIISIQQYIDSIQSTYSPNRNSFRPQVAMAYHALAEEYRLSAQYADDYDANRSAYRKANRAQFDSLIALGVKVLDDGLSPRRGNMIDFSCSAMEQCYFVQEAGIAIAGTYVRLEEIKKANAWIATVLKCEELSSGGGKPFFRELFMQPWKAFRFPAEQTALIS